MFGAVTVLHREQLHGKGIPDSYWYALLHCSSCGSFTVVPDRFLTRPRSGCLNCELGACPDGSDRFRAHLISYQGETLRMSDWAGRVGVSCETLRARLNRGWSVERTLTTPLLTKGRLM